MGSWLSVWRYFSLVDLLRAAVDIAIVAYVIYRLLLLIRGTRAAQLVQGLAVLALVAFLSDRLGLRTIEWILEKLGLVVLVGLPVVFQPELRRALAQLGRGRIFPRPFVFLGEEEVSRLIEEIVRCVQVLARSRIGALIVVEREVRLNEYAETGIKLDAVVSAEFLINLFMPRTPLHDGAAIIRGDRVAAAGCFLPLSDSPYLSRQLGTRHRAALGISELSDAVAVVVSEETGTVSVAEGGRLTRYLDEKNLRQMLEELVLPKNERGQSWWPWRL
ncbi:MAG: diadenylate cyclase CdaA [Clostridia bacterium]|nr:diadenylate cyclase CdaA [Clostridia bacterium]MDH7572057.1 diadenylate cyclase CdaA [Clostridia bacterium]